MDGVKTKLEWIRVYSPYVGIICVKNPNYLPSAADLDAVAEEQRIKEQTSAKVSDH